MNIDDFISEEKRLLAEFSWYWTKMHEENPADFPLDLESSQWLEQFQMFCEVTVDSYKEN
jgi:hypothetical protein